MQREELARAALEAATDVTDLVGARIHAGLAPVGETAPYCVYTLVGGDADTLIEGGRAFDRMRIQVDGYATTNAAAIALGLAICEAMESIGELLSLNPGGKDPYSNLYRSSHDFDVIEFTPYSTTPAGAPTGWPILPMVFGLGG